jgi:hypothetical protein
MPILAGLAVLENGYDRTAHVEAVRAADFESREPELLAMARRWLPRLPFERVDVLVVDEIGKNISGTGMDTNVINRKPTNPMPTPVIKKIYVRDLTDESHGNASGIGLADLTSKQLVGRTDWKTTFINCATSGWLANAAQPYAMDSDRDALEVLLRTVGLVEPPDARVIRIRNTLELGEVWASEAYLKELPGRADLTALSAPEPIAFDAAGNLAPW